VFVRGSGRFRPALKKSDFCLRQTRSRSRTISCGDFPMPTSSPTADKIFAEALLRAAGEERAAYLKEACGEHSQLLERVERLLRAHNDALSFLETPPSAVMREASPTLAQAPLEKPGTQIGPYNLLQQIGEGGMGVVYMAEQHEPVKR